MKKLSRSNIIGKNIETKSFTGRIVDETKNTIIVDVDGKLKTVDKATNVLKIDGKEINGIELTGRPEERIKRR